jgi:hypothetical protein
MPHVIQAAAGVTTEPQAYPSLPVGYSPHHWEKDGTTAQQVNQKQRILP